jgi:hypothetical protein
VGNGPFTYQWSNGATAPSITVTARGPNTSQSFSVTVRDTRENKSLSASKTVLSRWPVDDCRKYCQWVEVLRCCCCRWSDHS